MKEQLAVQNLLIKNLAEIQRANPRYSLRSFAKRVGVHVGALTGIMNGKRNISRKIAERITRKLLLDPQERSEVLQLFPEKRTRRRPDEKPAPAESRYCELNSSQFKVSSEWEHFAVLSLLNCRDFENTPAWIAGRLGITETRAERAVERLLQVGLLKVGSGGAWMRTRSRYRTPDDIADVSLKKHHGESLDLSKESLHRDPVSARDFTTVTMAIDPKRIASAKELIRKFQDELSDHLERDNRTEVYRLGIQLFPLSKVNDRKKGSNL